MIVVRHKSVNVFYKSSANIKYIEIKKINMCRYVDG